MTTTGPSFSLARPAGHQTEDRVAVHCLLGRKHVDLAITCIASLVRLSSEPLEPIFLDDGSLTPEDVDRLSAGIQGAKVLPRRETNERMDGALRRWPASRRYRSENVFGLKVLDTYHLGCGELLAHCDSDVLFLRPFSGLFAVPGGSGGVIMRDIESCYSVRSWQLLASRRLALGKDVNSGILSMRRDAYDPDLTEWYLSERRHHTKPYFAEQTFWAFMARTKRFRQYDPAQVAIVRPELRETDKLIAAHFVAMHRHLLPTYLARQRDESVAPIPIHTVPLRSCTSFDLAWCETRRVVDRAVAKLKRR